MRGQLCPCPGRRTVTHWPWGRRRRSSRGGEPAARRPPPLPPAPARQPPPEPPPAPAGGPAAPVGPGGLGSEAPGRRQAAKVASAAGVAGAFGGSRGPSAWPCDRAGRAAARACPGVLVRGCTLTHTRPHAVPATVRSAQGRERRGQQVLVCLRVRPARFERPRPVYVSPAPHLSSPPHQEPSSPASLWQVALGWPSRKCWDVPTWVGKEPPPRAPRIPGSHCLSDLPSHHPPSQGDHLVGGAPSWLQREAALCAWRGLAGERLVFATTHPATGLSHVFVRWRGS